MDKAPSTVSDLRKADEVTDEEINAAVEAYLIDPRAKPFQCASGYEIPIISVEYGWAGYSVYGYTQTSLFDFCNENGYICSDLVGNLIETKQIWLAVSDFVTWDFFLVPNERAADWSEIFERRQRA